MSPPLENAGIRVDYEQCVEAFLDTIKLPVKFFTMQWESDLKVREVEETDSGSRLTLKVKIVLDGEKLRERALKEPHNQLLQHFGNGRDLIVHDEEAVWNKKLRAIDHSHFNTPRRPGDQRKLTLTAITTFLDPLAVTHSVTFEGKQYGHADVRAGFQVTFDSAIGKLRRQINQKVKLVLDKENQIIKTTSPMEPYIDYESFFDKYLNEHKQAPKQLGIAPVSETFQENDEVSVISYARPDGSDAGFAIFEAQRSTGTIAIEFNLPDNPVGCHVRKVAKITKSPLAFECWIEERYTKVATDVMLERESMALQMILEPPKSRSWLG